MCVVTGKKGFDRVSLIILRMLNFSVSSVRFHIMDFHFCFYGRQIRFRYYEDCGNGSRSLILLLGVIKYSQFKTRARDCNSVRDLYFRSSELFIAFALDVKL